MRSLFQELILNSQSLSQTKQLHAQFIIRNLLSNSRLLTSSLILSYTSFNVLNYSSILFNSSKLSHQPNNAVLFNSLIRFFSTSNLHLDSLLTYNSMQFIGVRPDDRTFPFALKACADAKTLNKGKELHGSVEKLGFMADVFVGNTLLGFYGACGDLVHARQVFDEMCQRDVVSWNTIISVNLGNGYFVEAMDWFKKLVRSGIEVNSVSFISILPACGVTGTGEFGVGVHGFAVKVGLDSHVKVANAIADMYGKCGDSKALVRMFCRMNKRNDVSWNSVISNLVHVGSFEDSVRVFRDMLADNEVEPNSITVSSLLPALVELGWFGLGKEVHGYCIRKGMNSDVYVGNSLLDMYAKYGFMNKASSVFDRMEGKNVVSWNAMIANLAQNGAHVEAIKLVIVMQTKGERPSSVTFTNVLPACARIASLNKGKEVHALSIRDGSCLDLFVSNALIDMYAKCGRLNLSTKVFGQSERDEVSYNTLIVGYSQSARCSESLRLFFEMGLVGLQHDVVSFMGVLSACANLSALKQGKEIHCLSIKTPFSTHIFIANSLLDFYTKCGKIHIARKIFNMIPNKDVASWNAMILGYGMQGELETSIDLFDLMESEGVECDHVSYIAVLSACSHGGLLGRGKKYFHKMLAQKIRPSQMHYACMVDLLGRAGLLDEAENLIKDMPFDADSNVWGALLGACRVHGNLDMGRRAAERLFVLKPEHCGYYILMSNMYAESGRWEEANKIRERMKSNRAKKNPGCSWIETGNDMCGFVAGEQMKVLEDETCYVETCQALGMPTV